MNPPINKNDSKNYELKNNDQYINTIQSWLDVWFDDISISNYRGSVLDEHFYYPFGLTLSSESAEETGQPYKLTTKELEKSFDLNFYDFGARGFDMQRGQWMQIDPLSEKYFSYSPYNYVLNNPVMYVDPDGRIVEDPDNLIQNYKTDIYNQNVDVNNPVERINDETDGDRCKNCLVIPLQDSDIHIGEKKSSYKGLGNKKSDNPLKDSKGENVYSLTDFLKYNEGFSLDEIINQRPKNMNMPGGPEMRYVKNPVDGNIMDMRHVLVVGYKYGGVVGFGVEVLQGIHPKTRPSSMDPQDFYSNKIGHNFFWYVGHKNESIMTRFSFYFKEVLGWQKGGGW